MLLFIIILTIVVIITRIYLHLLISSFFLIELKARQLWLLVLVGGGRVRLVRNTCMCGEDLSLKPGWSPIQELVTLAGVCSRSTFVTGAKHRLTPDHTYIFISTYYKLKYGYRFTFLKTFSVMKLVDTRFEIILF